MEYKGYFGTVEYDEESNTFYGKIIKVKDLIMYEAENLHELRDRFIEAVEDYIGLKTTKINLILEMPESCEQCPMFHETDGSIPDICQLHSGNWQDSVIEDPYVKPEWCPLLKCEVISREM